MVEPLPLPSLALALVVVDTAGGPALPVTSLILGLVGSLLSILTAFLGKRLAVPRFLAKLEAGQRILLAFGMIVFVFGIVTVIQYWDRITQYEDTIYYVVWLFLTMIAGMFVQVLSSNYTSGRPLFAVAPSQLVYPLLFALIVFYPVWAVAASAPQNLFSFYAAFLNGFFWETAVSNARLPAEPPSHPPPSGESPSAA